jgi:hypothetical protein
MESEYQDAIALLSKQYYENEISKEFYIERRRALIDRMEKRYNGSMLAIDETIQNYAVTDITQKKY